jgi:hypothetical protein
MKKTFHTSPGWMDGWKRSILRRNDERKHFLLSRSEPKVTIELPRCRKVNISKVNISPSKRGKETVRTTKDGGKVKFQTF